MVIFKDNIKWREQIQNILYFCVQYFKQYILKTIVIDNYDSFTYNLVRYIHIVTKLAPVVVRNNEFEIDYINDFDVIVFSPGPGLPKDAGLMMEVLKQYAKTKKILGVCLGHQAIAEFFGNELRQLAEVKHGVASELRIIKHDSLYAGVPNSSKVGRYHSWVVDETKLSNELEVTAVADNTIIMSFKHKKLPIFGVQYHPESILTTYGLKIIENFYKI